MSEYSPLDDMKFALKEVVNVNSLSELPAFNEVGLEALDSLLDEASRFFNGNSPTNRTGDLEGSSLNDDGSVSTPSGFREAYAQYVDARVGCDCLTEYGGGGFPASRNSSHRNAHSSKHGLIPQSNAHSRFNPCAYSTWRSRTKARMVTQINYWRMGRDHELNRTTKDQTLGLSRPKQNYKMMEPIRSPGRRFTSRGANMI